MKKQALTLTMCLALTATCALATETTSLTQKTCATSALATVKKQNNNVCEKNINMDKTDKASLKKDNKKMMEEKMDKERELMYNALNLTTEQRAKAEELHLKTKDEVKVLFKKVRAEKCKLDDLFAKKASAWDVWTQEHEVKMAKKEIKNYLNSSRKEFNTILTKEQQSKFKLIEEERKTHMKEFKKSHKNYKKEMNQKHSRSKAMEIAPAGCKVDKK